MQMTISDQHDADARPSEFASPTGLMHEADSACDGSKASEAAPSNIPAWRQTERQRLIDERKSLLSAQREEFTRLIATYLDHVIADVAGQHVSMFWPFLGEPDLRGWMATATARGATCLLPVVIAKNTPLIFRSWKIGERLERGIWNIPVPAEGRQAIPDVVIAPLVGFDNNCFRLGYGGGYFDRTLAYLAHKPLIIGVGFESQKINTIHPLAHDIPMDVIVTDTGVRYR
jgi:5,10-methenyltetrahydrofolate synthetase